MKGQEIFNTFTCVLYVVIGREGRWSERGGDGGQRGKGTVDSVGRGEGSVRRGDGGHRGEGTGVKYARGRTGISVGRGGGQRSEG